jgi:hypothetical protein
MRRILGLTMVAGLCLALAPRAGAQMSLGIGNPYGGGIFVNSYPTSYGYNPVYGGMGYYPTGYGLGLSSLGTTAYAPGYVGVTPGVTSIYSSGYSGLAPGLGYNPYLPYPSTVNYGAYGTTYFGSSPYGVYSSRRGLFGGMRSRAVFW